VKAGRGASAARFIVVLDSKGAAMTIRYRVDLDEAEHTQLAALLNGGTHAVRKIKRAQILLAADAGASDAVIASNISVGISTVYRTRRRFVEGNLEAALSEELARERLASCPASRRRCWWPPRVPPHQPGASAGRWNCWLARWSD
jgi:hypothetical protein